MPDDRVITHNTAMIPRVEHDALLLLYHGVLESQQNGTGYSPKTAEACRKLKDLGL